jgi:hypothetical protein
LALRVVGGLHALLDMDIPVTDGDIVDAHREYIESVKIACMEYLTSKSKIPTQTARATIKEALGLVGALDHLLAVYRVEQMFLGEIRPLEQFDNDALFSLMEAWVRTKAEKENIEIR